MKIRVLKTKNEISSEVLFEAIDNYLNKSHYPKSLVTKKLDISLEKYKKIEKEINENVTKFSEKLLSGRNKLNDIKMKNATHTASILGRLSRNI